MHSLSCACQMFKHFLPEYILVLHKLNQIFMHCSYRHAKKTQQTNTHKPQRFSARSAGRKDHFEVLLRFASTLQRPRSYATFSAYLGALPLMKRGFRSFSFPGLPFPGAFPNRARSGVTIRACARGSSRFARGKFLNAPSQFGPGAWLGALGA